MATKIFTRNPKHCDALVMGIMSYLVLDFGTNINFLAVERKIWSTVTPRNPNAMQKNVTGGQRPRSGGLLPLGYDMRNPHTCLLLL